MTYKIEAIACVKEPLETFSYREVIVNYNGKFYLENVNVLFGSKILEKIRFTPGKKPYSKGMGKEIALRYLEEVFSNHKKAKSSKNKKTTGKKIKVNKKATQKAAEDIFSSMGL